MKCPDCQSSDHFVTSTMGEHRRVSDDGITTEYWPAVNDHECKNCGFQWVVPQRQEDLR